MPVAIEPRHLGGGIVVVGLAVAAQHLRPGRALDGRGLNWHRATVRVGARRAADKALRRLPRRVARHCVVVVHLATRHRMSGDACQVMSLRHSVQWSTSCSALPLESSLPRVQQRQKPQARSRRNAAHDTGTQLPSRPTPLPGCGLSTFQRRIAHSDACSELRPRYSILQFPEPTWPSSLRWAVQAFLARSAAAAALAASCCCAASRCTSSRSRARSASSCSAPGPVGKTTCNSYLLHQCVV